MMIVCKYCREPAVYIITQLNDGIEWSYCAKHMRREVMEVARALVEEEMMIAVYKGLSGK